VKGDVLRASLMWGSDLDEDYSVRNFDNLYKSVGHNTGNVAFVHAIKKLVKIDVVSVPWHSVGEIKSEVLVFPAANQLGRHTDLGDLASGLEMSGAPIVVIGLGAQADDENSEPELKPGTQFWLETILKNRPSFNSNIWTRGEYTSNQIRRLVPGSDPVTGCCPSLFINQSAVLGKDLSINKSDFRRVAVAAGNQGFRGMSKIEPELASLVSDSLYPGRYITQSMGEMIALGLGQFEKIDGEKMKSLNKYIAPWLDESGFKNWCRTYARTYFDAKSWMYELSNFDAVVGARYHGVALGLQAGIPGVLIAIDSRTYELGLATGVPTIKSIEIDSITRRYLKTKWEEFDPIAYDSSRVALAQRFHRFLTDNLLEPTDHLKKLADPN
jgi:hypothetical protein